MKITATLLGAGFAIALGTARSQEVTLPFGWSSTVRTDHLPEFVAPPGPNLYNGSPTLKVGWGIDSPTGFVRIGKEVWVFFNSGNQYGTTVKVARYRGSDFEHTERQADGVITVGPGVSTHFCGGLWYDSTAGKLYAPIHCEYDRGIQPPAGWCRKKTRLATSTDRGETWTMEGDILTDVLPENGDWLKFSGSYFEAGPADFDFYADERGGYFYIFTCNAFAPKSGAMNNFLWFNEAARCPIADRMAPGKWRKFCRGTWSEPGLGGKSSRVTMGSYSIYGRVIYNRFLHTYMRIGVVLGAVDRRYTRLGFGDGSIYCSTCDDLAAQRWTPMGKLIDDPPNAKFGFTLTDGEGRDPASCDSTLRVYNYWLYDIPSRAIDITFVHGRTRAAGFPRYGSYAFEPLPESGDTLVSRRTKIVGCDDSATRYGGPGWTRKTSAAYFHGAAMESGEKGAFVQFSFRGPAIYWRAVADSAGGKADVFLDGKSAGTVDTYFRDEIPNQFAFVRTGLDPRMTHTCKAVVRGDRNPLSAGTRVRHMAFEYGAESYWASAGFSSVQGKNNWYYFGPDGREMRFLDFDRAPAETPGGKERKTFANEWRDASGGIVGHSYQACGTGTVARAWIAPRAGTILIECSVLADTLGIGAATITCNEKAIWSGSVSPDGAPASYARSIAVSGGDTVRFSLAAHAPSRSCRVTWDPVLTYTK
ncbi:MAG TPA: hypothetical protein VML00_09210 [Bacteroidota bacterium]|nr:hypothetical protein [Bacteroidota bacterium]